MARIMMAPSRMNNTSADVLRFSKANSPNQIDEPKQCKQAAFLHRISAQSISYRMPYLLNAPTASAGAPLW
jgi:hypothetical protein